MQFIRKHRKIILPVMGLGLCVITLVFVKIGFQVYCNTVPTVSIYPDSTLIDTQKHSVAAIDTYKLYYFEVSDKPEKVIEFYQQLGCEKARLGNDDGFSCTGKTNRKGTYFVYVDIDMFEITGKTQYYVELSWRDCGWQNM